MIAPLLEVCPPGEQASLDAAAYDSWVSPDGDIVAQFYRSGDGYLMRFPGRADFCIAADCRLVNCTPVPDTAPEAIAALFANSVRPVIGNHCGRLNLHGSAVVVGGRALAFMGLSRRGKTTLAGAFAMAGHPFVTEDVLAVERSGGAYALLPQPQVLRVFADSAAFLLGSAPDEHGDGVKRELPGFSAMPAENGPVAIGAICILGPGVAEQVEIARLGRAAALAEMLRHGFILDVQDRARLHGHFDRVAALAESVACYRLDYPRIFAQLPGVVDAIARQFSGDRAE